METLQTTPHSSSIGADSLHRGEPPGLDVTVSSFAWRAPWTRSLDLVFLVGSPRSGTTWLQAMLAAHPAIYTGPETQFFGSYAPVEREYLKEKDGRCGISEYLGPERFYRLIEESFWNVLSALPEPPRQPLYFLEKSPYHCVFGEFILRVFPNARFIHLIRDGRAVVASLLRVSQSWAESWAPRDVKTATQFWFDCVRAGCGISERVGSPEQYLGIRYEDVRAEPEAYLTGLFEWLGLSADPETVRNAIAANQLESRVSGELFPSIAMPNPSSRFPRFPEGFVGPAPACGRDAGLTAADRHYVETIAQDVLLELGYEI